MPSFSQKLPILLLLQGKLLQKFIKNPKNSSYGLQADTGTY
jgi:hypothetical protein